MRWLIRAFATSKLSLAGALVIVALIIAALLAPLISPYDPGEIFIEHKFRAPSRLHLLGTDQLGRDVLSRLIYGTRISLSVGFVAVGIAVIIGILVGGLSGYYGGLIDNLLMRLVDVMLCFPSFFLILTVVALLTPNIFVVMSIIGLFSWMGVARLVRAEFLTLKERDFVLAARSLGASDSRIIFRHILPHALTPVLVSASLGIAGAILLEAGLSFLGLGVQPPSPSWGNILTEGRIYIFDAWWLTLFPGAAILLTVLSFNLLAEGLRDYLDPRQRNRKI